MKLHLTPDKQNHYKPAAEAEGNVMESKSTQETAQLKAFQQMANQSKQVQQGRQFTQMANQHRSSPIQQKKEDSASNTQDGVGSTTSSGLPMQLKSGIESLSGQSMDDVKVHYNSSKPAQLQAHAYAQGTDIHLASGQEKHLPHEAWHVVQQKQGRVQPTTQLKGKVNVNDDKGLEKEADVMGAKSLQTAQLQSHAKGCNCAACTGGDNVQRKKVDNTTQLQSIGNNVNNKVNINDDEGLEKEADEMGAKALQTAQLQSTNNNVEHKANINDDDGLAEKTNVFKAKPLQTAQLKSINTSSHEKGCTCSACTGATQEVVQGKFNNNAEPVQRVLNQDLDLEGFLEAMQNEDSRKITDNIPSTGLGRFDAEYLPQQGKLKVTVKAFLDFGDKMQDQGGFQSGLGNWTNEEKVQFATAFQTQAESAWSEKYTFKCKKSGFESLTATPEVTFVSVNNIDEAHFHHRIAKNQVRSTGIGREQSNPESDSRINIGNFTQGNQEVKSQKYSTCRSIASHDKRRIANILEAHKINQPLLRFVDNGVSELTQASKSKVDLFVNKLRETNRPGSVPIPIIAKGYDNKRDRIGGGKALDRAATLKDYIDSKLGNLRNTVETASFNDEVDAAKSEYDEYNQKYKAKKNSSTKKSMERRKKAYEDLQSKQNHRQAEVAFDAYFQWQGDPYSVLAHEFGHMLGNPDEYFSYGSSKIRDSKVRQLEKTGKKEDLLRAKQLEAKVFADDKNKAPTQEAFTKLAEDANVDIPEFDSVNANIMSAGADVLPVHYTPMLEALSRITNNTLDYTDWKIE